jgi:hypothetical protein
MAAPHLQLAPSPAPMPSVAAVDAAPTPAPTVSPEATKQIQKIALGIGGAGVLVFIAVGFVAYPRLIARTQALRESAADQSRRQVVATPTESVVPGSSTMPAAMAEKQPTSATQPAVAAKTTAPSVASHAVAPVTETSAAAAAASDTDSAGADAFKAWVDRAKIGGVRTGHAPRVLIGARAYNQGDIIDEALGIAFDGYDDATHMVRFRDRSGRVLQRRDR